MWTLKLLWLWFLYVFLVWEPVGSNPVSTNFNASLRDYTVKEDDINSTNIRTLQKEETGRPAKFAPVRNPIVFKEVPDNELSSSSFSRGLLHSEGGGYGLQDYEEAPHYGYEYHGGSDHHSGLHGHYGTHGGHGVHGGHGHYGGGPHFGYGHYHKHFDHGLAAKALLWPVAGIALLGAAAALVSNPVLLQLGVISGRRRRDTEEVSGPDFDVTTLAKWSKDEDKWNLSSKGVRKLDLIKGLSKKRVLKNAKQKVLSSKAYPTRQSVIETVTPGALNNKDVDDGRFLPVPLVKRN